MALQRIQPQPEDLVQIWQDYRYMTTLHPPHLNPTPAPTVHPSWGKISSQVMAQVTRWPLLLHIAAAKLWSDHSHLSAIRHLLNASWDEVRVALCSLRPILPDQLALWAMPSLLIHDWMVEHQATWRSDICTHLTRGCIRVSKLIETGVPW
jgi:hypothetical protein